MMNRGRTILLVDDDTRNIFALSAFLRSRGFQCLSAADVRTALEMLENEMAIGVVLMDMMMPEIDGYEAISMIRQRTALQELPVIAVTAQAMTGDRQKCLDAGADGYISKPVDIDELTGLLQDYLN